MYLDILIAKKKWSKYQLAKVSKVPYTTLNDLFRGKTSMAKVNAETLYRLSLALGLSMEALLKLSKQKIKQTERIDPERFKSNLQHELKAQGALRFIQYIMDEDLISEYDRLNWNFETFYVLATLDYFCRLELQPIASKYDTLRFKKLKDIHFPFGMMLSSKLKNDPSLLETELNRSIPEFKRFNIVETDLFDVA